MVHFTMMTHTESQVETNNSYSIVLGNNAVITTMHT